MHDCVRTSVAAGEKCPHQVRQLVIFHVQLICAVRVNANQETESGSTLSSVTEADIRLEEAEPPVELNEGPLSIRDLGSGFG